MSLLGKWNGLSGRDKRCFLEAAWWLGYFRTALLFASFKTIAARLGRHMTESASEPLAPALREEAKAVSRAVQTMARYLPWPCACLVQAAAGKRMLDRRGIPATIYFGAAGGEKGEVLAHAWLRAGDAILTGKAGRERFTIVGIFS